MNELFVSILVLGGATLMLIAAVGVVRLPDVLCRSHAVAKALTLGIFLLLLGLWVHLGETQPAFKILLAILFQVITIPVASHLVGLLSLQQDLPRWRHRPMDDHRVAAATTTPPTPRPAPGGESAPGLPAPTR
jgi:multicomponent Na+:H+ antiporter subunit G